MAYRNFEELFSKMEGSAKKKVVLAGAQDAHALEAVLKAAKEGFIEYLLVGKPDATVALAYELGYEISSREVVQAEDPLQAAILSVDFVRKGEGDFLMKGKMETATLLKQVVDREQGIGTGNLMSHLAIIDSPRYHKLLAVSDGGMILYPDISQKIGILENALEFFRNIGTEKPKVGVMAAVETVNPKMQETLDGASLKKMAEEGRWGDCLVEGPISFDLAVSREAAEIKGFESPVAGEVDLMLMPSIAAGNLTVKALATLGEAKMAGCVLGAKVPVVVPSRGSSLEEKYISLLLCAAFVS
jgi:phosphate butyryltransferase